MKTEIINKLIDFISTSGMNLIYAILFLVVFTIISKIILVSIRKILSKNKKSKIFNNFIAQIFKYLLIFVGIMVTAEFLGIPNTSIVAVFGTFTLAIGLTIKDIMSNIANGMVLINADLISENDLVEIGGMTGVVDTVKLMFTCVITSDGKTVTIPNSSVMSSTITNYSKKGIRRIDLVFGVGYDSNMSQVKTVINDVIDNIPAIKQDEGVTIRMTNHNESSIDFDVKVWVQSSDWATTRYDIIENVFNAFKENNIEIPYKKIDVYHHNNIETIK